MTLPSFVVTALVCWAVLVALGRLAYRWQLGGLLAAPGGPASEVWRRRPLLWALALGDLAMAAFLTLAVGQWAGPSQATLALGFMNGAMIGALIAFASNLWLYGASTVSTLQAVMVDTLVTTLRFGAAGAAIGVMMAR